MTFLLVLHGREYTELGLSLTGQRHQRYRQVVIDIKDAVNPLVTIVSLLISAQLLGILGVLLAIPSAAAIQIILPRVVDGKGVQSAEPQRRQGADALTSAPALVISSRARRDRS